MLFPFHDDNPTRRTAVATLAIIAINVAAFLWLWQLPEPQQEVAVYQYGFVPARVAQLADREPIVVRLLPAEVGPFWAPPVAERRITLPPDPRDVFRSVLT